MSTTKKSRLYIKVKRWMKLFQGCKIYRKEKNNILLKMAKCNIVLDYQIKTKYGCIVRVGFLLGMEK